jgi:dienelactone hydrolase
MHENCKTIESIKQFADGRLCGIASLPKSPKSYPTAVIVLNAGMLHRSGPFRVSTNLCRTLAERGFISFRFDLSNIGDSLPQAGYSEQNNNDISDIRAAMDLLQREFGVDRFILSGLCTGADNAHKAALADARVKGIVMMDGYGFPTPRFYLQRLTGLLSNPPRVLKTIKDRFSTAYETDEESLAFTWTMPEKQALEQELATLISRKTPMLYTYTGAVRNYYTYPEQMTDSFPALDLQKYLTVLCYPQADHTMTLSSDRTRISNDICDWICAQFGES